MATTPPPPAQNLTDLTVVIVNWNVGHLVKECLRSLYRFTQTVSLEVCIVDNGSREGDLDEVVLAFPQAHYIFLKENLGFAKANNIALRRAGSRYVALLNPDTLLLNRAFDLLVDFLDRHPEVGAAGPKLLTPDGGIQFDAGRNLPTLTTEFSHNFFIHTLFPQSRLGGGDYIRWWDHLDSRQVGALCGACMVVRREAIAEAGLLDETFFLYWEDVEWCYRIGQAGWQVSYQPGAEVYHLGGHSMAQDASASLECSYRSAVLYFRKHHGLAASMVARALILCGSVLRLGLALGLFIIPRRRTEARDRLRCYGRTIAWLLTGRLAADHSMLGSEAESDSSPAFRASESDPQPDEIPLTEGSADSLGRLTSPAPRLHRQKGI